MRDNPNLQHFIAQVKIYKLKEVQHNQMENKINCESKSKQVIFYNKKINTNNNNSKNPNRK